jgi:hypothetical protein
MPVSYPIIEPFILIAPTQRIAEEWTFRHLKNLSRRPVVASDLIGIEHCVRGQRDRLVIVLPSFTGNLDPLSFLLQRNILIDLRNIDPRPALF